MAIANPTMGLHGPGIIKKASGWFLAIAVVFILLGIMAIVEPGVAGLAVAILVGWLLIFGGIAHLIATFSAGGEGRVIWQMILAILYVVGSTAGAGRADAAAGRNHSGGGGARNPGGCEPADDRNLATHARDGRAEISEPTGSIAAGMSDRI